MTSYDYPIEHFQMMVEISTHLQQIPAQLLEHNYNYQAFGSWFFIFRRSGTKYRITFDGRDCSLLLEKAVSEKPPISANASTRVLEWNDLRGKILDHPTSESILIEITSFLEAIE